MPDTTDPYAGQKANIRETVKYMAAAYAACGTVIFAGASLSGIGALSPDRLALVLLAGGTALLCVLVGIKQVLDLLNTDFVFASNLSPAATAFINTNRADLLPPGCLDYAALQGLRNAANNTVAQERAAWQALPDLPGPQDPQREAVVQRRADATARYELALRTLAGYDVWVQRAVNAAHLHLMSEGLKSARVGLGVLTVIGIVAAGVAVYAISKPKVTECNVTVSSLAPPRAGAGT